MLLFIKEGPSPMAHVPRCPDMSVVPVTAGLLGIGKSCKRGRKPAQEGVRTRLNTKARTKHTESRRGKGVGARGPASGGRQSEGRGSQGWGEKQQ